MAKRKYDFTDVDDQDFGALPAGKYPVYVFEHNFKESRSGNPMTVLVLKVAEGKGKGRQFWFNLVETPKSMWKIKETLEALGYDIPKKAVSIDWDEVLGKKAIAVVTKGKYKGKDTNNVEKLLPYDGEETPDDTPDSPSEETDDEEFDADDFDVPF